MDATTTSNHSGKTLRNEHGSYPNWLSKRKIGQLKDKAKKKKAKTVDGGKVSKKKVNPVSRRNRCL